MARDALIKPAMIATTTLWSAVVLSAVTGLTSGRLHGALITGAAVASIWLISVAAIAIVTDRMKSVATVAIDAVVEKMRQTVYHFDRGYDVATRAVVAGLVDASRDPLRRN